jgi:hypothetical protein
MFSQTSAGIKIKKIMQYGDGATVEVSRSEKHERIDREERRVYEHPPTTSKSTKTNGIPVLACTSKPSLPSDVTRDR